MFRLVPYVTEWTKIQQVYPYCTCVSTFEKCKYKLNGFLIHVIEVINLFKKYISGVNK